MSSPELSASPSDTNFCSAAKSFQTKQSWYRSACLERYFYTVHQNIFLDCHGITPLRFCCSSRCRSFHRCIWIIRHLVPVVVGGFVCFFTGFRLHQACRECSRCQRQGFCLNLSRIFSGIVIDDIVYTIVGIEIFVAAVGINRQ